jgi:hypothetical protein
MAALATALVVLAAIGLMGAALARLAKAILDRSRTPDGDTIANRLQGRSPAEYLEEQADLVRRQQARRPPLADGPRRLLVAGCVGLAFGLMLPWGRTGDVAAPGVLDSGAGRLFAVGVVAASLLVFRQATRGAPPSGRVALLVLAVLLAGCAAFFLVHPPVPAAPAGLGPWLCLLGASVLCGGAAASVRPGR